MNYFNQSMSETETKSKYTIHNNGKRIFSNCKLCSSLTKFFLPFRLCRFFFSDPRTDSFIFASPVSLFLLSASYVYTVKVLLPRFMKNKKPYDLRNVIICYDFFQILCNIWFCYQVVSITSFKYFTKNSIHSLTQKKYINTERKFVNSSDFS